MELAIDALTVSIDGRGFYNILSNVEQRISTDNIILAGMDSLSSPKNDYRNLEYS